MSAITFDTLKFVNAQRDILSEALDTSLATRADMLVIKADIERLDTKFDAKFDKLQWMLGIVIALAIANFVKQFF